MIEEYVIKDNDTVQSISKLFYNDASQWRNIVFFNNLDYPFITNNQNFIKEVFASGTVTFSIKSLAIGDIIIPKDTRVGVSGTDKYYRTQSTKIILVGSTFVSTNAVCEFAGYWGNTSANSIDFIDLNILNILVTNENSFVNGARFNVKKTGEILLIPINENEIVYLIADNYLETLGKEDLFFDRDFDIDNYGDLSSLIGLQNIAQRISHRLEIEKGELVYHPDYGTNLYQILGRKEPFIKKRTEIEIKDTILQDEAVSDAIIKNIYKERDKIIIECSLKLINQDRLESFRFSIEGG